MLSSYLRLSFRFLSKKFNFALINIVGLSAGLICVVFILNWVYDELTYDQHYTDSEKIYRIVAEAGSGTDRWHQAVTSLPLGTAVLETYPEVTAMARLDYNDAMVEHGEDQFIEDEIVLTDPQFFEIFDVRLLQGNLESFTNEPYQLIVTESIARKYFGRENPIGKSLKMYMYDPDGKGANYKITGVIPDSPDKSHITYQMLVSMSTMASVRESEMQNWMNNSYYTYIKLSDQESSQNLEQQFPEMVTAHMGEEIEEYDLYYRFYLQPNESIHLNSDIQYEIRQNGRMEYVILFSLIGVLILVLAVINYINLSTAFAMDRVREIGVRKVMGAYKAQLVVQYLSESLVISLISMVVAFIGIKLLIPFFIELTGKPYLEFNTVELVSQLIIVALPIGLIAGIFPARMMSGFSITRSLKGKIQFQSRTHLRSILVGIQYGITGIILIGVVVIYQQLNYLQSKDLGYASENLVFLKVNGSEEVKAGYDGFKNELLQQSSVLKVARSGSGISSGLSNSNGRVVHENGNEQVEKIYQLSVGYDYLDAYGIELIAGRFFDPDIHSDSTQAFVLNESSVRTFGWTSEEAIGKDFRFRGREGRIIGVVNDFHFNSLHYSIESVCMYIRNNFSRINIQVMDPSLAESDIKKLWTTHFPESIYDYGFQDEAIRSTYRSDLRFATIVNVFSVLSIIIAFMGLFGLVGFTVHKRTKEIAIRKVLGATSLQILSSLSKSFLKVIIISLGIGIPLAWIMMGNWLQTFPYHIKIKPIFILYAGGSIVLGSFIIILGQALKSSKLNPAETIKEE